MTAQPQKVDIAGHRSPFKYKGADGYFYTYESSALGTFGILGPGTAQWELVKNAIYPSPEKHFVFLTFSPATYEKEMV